MSNSGQEKFLLEGLASQDKNIIEYIYKNYFEMICSLIVKNKGSWDDAADVFQEAMIILYQKSLNKDFELNCLFKTYLYSVCRRLWLKRLQKNRKTGFQIEDLEHLADVEADLEEHQEKQNNFQLMENALKKIGEPCKSLLDAYYIHNKSMLEIAADFKYTNADNAKTQKYKCMMRLKKLFFSEHKNKH